MALYPILMVTLPLTSHMPIEKGKWGLSVSAVGENVFSKFDFGAYVVTISFWASCHKFIDRI